MHFKIITLTLFLAFSSNYIVADEWPEKECNKLSGYVGFLSAASAGSFYFIIVVRSTYVQIINITSSHGLTQ